MPILHTNLKTILKFALYIFKNVYIAFGIINTTCVLEQQFCVPVLHCEVFRKHKRIIQKLGVVILISIKIKFYKGLRFSQQLCLKSIKSKQ